MSSYKVSVLYDLVDRYSKNARKIANSTKRMGKAISSAGQKMRGLSLMATAGVTASAYAFGKFEKNLTNVKTLLNENQIKKYSGALKNAQETAIRFGFSLGDAGKGLFDVNSALGLSENSMKAYKSAQVLAIGGNATLGSSVLGLAKVMNAYGKETTNTMQVANALFTAQKVGTTTVEEMANNVGKVAGSARVAGVGINELMATLAVLTNVLPNTEVASTSLNAILKAVSNPGKQAQKVFNKLGIVWGTSAVRAVGFTNVLKQISKASKENIDLLGEAIPNVRAFRGIASLTDENLQLINKTMKNINTDMKNGTGLQKAYNMQMKTFAQKMKMAKGAVTVLGKELGKQLAPTIVKLAKGLTWAVDKFRQLSPVTKQFIAITLAVSAVLVPLLITVGYMTTGLGALGSAFGIAEAGASGLMATLAPIAGLFGVIGGAVLALDNFFNSTNQKIKEFRDMLMPLLKSGIFNMFGTFGQAITKYAGARDLKDEYLKIENNQKQKEFNASINMNIKAPKGVVEKPSFTPTSGANLGLNLLEY